MLSCSESSTQLLQSTQPWIPIPSYALVLQYAYGKNERVRKHSGNLDRHAELLIAGVGWSSPARHAPRRPPVDGIIAPVADELAESNLSDWPAAIQQDAALPDLLSNGFSGEQPCAWQHTRAGTEPHTAVLSSGCLPVC